MQFLKFLLGGSCKSHTWLSNPEEKSLHPDPGSISLESVWEGISIKSTEADYLIFGWREPSDMIFHILIIKNTYEAFIFPPWVSDPGLGGERNPERKRNCIKGPRQQVLKEGGMPCLSRYLQLSASEGLSISAFQMNTWMNEWKNIRLLCLN